MTNAQKAERQESIDRLQFLMPKGCTVYTVMRHVSSSGMTRYMDLYVMHDNRPSRITWQASKALEWTYDNKRDSLKVGGCGMDMGFHAVYTLARVVHGDGYSINHEWL